MRRSLRYVFVLASACATGSATTSTTASASRACVVGQFVSAMEDDGHGVMVELTAPRTSAAGYQPSNEQSFYLHDKGNPTRGLKLGDEVWLIQNDPGSAWPWLYLTADEARARCPALPAP